ncbi:hypothetical protein NPIL_279631, partial [Nephila pilipes]
MGDRCKRMVIRIGVYVILGMHKFLNGVTNKRSCGHE